LTSGGLN